MSYLSISISNGLAPIDGAGLNAVNRDLVQTMPRAHLRSIERRCERRITLGEQLHAALGLLRLTDSVCFTDQHHAAPVGWIGNLFDLETDFVVGGNNFGLRSFGRKEIKVLPVIRIIHRHDVRMSVARAAQVSEV